MNISNVGSVQASWSPENTVNENPEKEKVDDESTKSMESVLGAMITAQPQSSLPNRVVEGQKRESQQLNAEALNAGPAQPWSPDWTYGNEASLKRFEKMQEGSVNAQGAPTDTKQLQKILKDLVNAQSSVGMQDQRSSSAENSNSDPLLLAAQPNRQKAEQIKAAKASLSNPSGTGLEGMPYAQNLEAEVLSLNVPEGMTPRARATVGKADNIQKGSSNIEMNQSQYPLLSVANVRPESRGEESLESEPKLGRSPKFGTEELKNPSVGTRMDSIQVMPGGQVVFPIAQSQPKLSPNAPITGHVVPGAMAKDRLSHESIQNVADQIRTQSQLKQGGEIRIRLNPQNLGELVMRVKTRGNEVGLQVKASDPKAKKVLEESVQSLKDGLSQHQLQLEKIEVVVNSTPFQNTSSNSQFGADSGGASMDRGAYSQERGGGSEARDSSATYRENSSRSTAQNRPQTEAGRLDLIA